MQKVMNIYTVYRAPGTMQEGDDLVPERVVTFSHEEDIDKFFNTVMFCEEIKSSSPKDALKRGSVKAVPQFHKQKRIEIDRHSYYVEKDEVYTFQNVLDHQFMEKLLSFGKTTDG